MKYQHLINLLKVGAVAYDGCSDCLIILAASIVPAATAGVNCRAEQSQSFAINHYFRNSR